MARLPRVDVGNAIYHVLNRANARQRIFNSKLDYEAFELLLAEAQERCPMRLLSYCIMPNHWHLALYPKRDGDLAAFVGWLAQAHACRWRAAHGTVGFGHLYQGRFKSFPIQDDVHLLTVCRYIERNPLRAKLVQRAQDWKWSSAWLRVRGRTAGQPVLSDWPTPPPHDFLRWLNAPMTAGELEDIRNCVVRGRPYGDESWTKRTAERFGLAQAFRPRGRPTG